MPKNFPNKKPGKIRNGPLWLPVGDGARACRLSIVVETVFRTSRSHPFHWLSMLVGGVLGFGTGWLW